MLWRESPYQFVNFQYRMDPVFGGYNTHTHRTLRSAPHTPHTASSLYTPTARAARKKTLPNWRSWATAPEPPNLKHKLRHATTGQHGRGAQINSTYNEKGTAKDPGVRRHVTDFNIEAVPGVPRP